MTESDTGGRKRVVLLVDDDLPIIDAATMLLEGEGFHICCASNFDEAIAHIGNGVLPDIIITDYRLQGRTGIEVVQYARELLAREVPALMMTGDTSPETAKVANVASLKILRKPFLVGNLIAQIKEALEKSAMTALLP